MDRFFRIAVLAPKGISLIPVNTLHFSGNEARYLQECIETGWISSEGPFVKRFESEFAAYIGQTHGIAVANGSAALDVAVRAAGIGPGDEVIVPTFTIISPVQSIVTAGANPILVDSDPVTWNMDTSKIEEKITSRTKAIMVVHIYGLPVEMSRIHELAVEHNLLVIEDAAEMHGQTCNGQRCGSFGDLSTFSFYPNKLITTGEGGIVLTSNEGFAERARLLRNLCFKPEQRFVHDELGWNYRMTNLQAAVGVAQLENIAQAIARKREIGRMYSDSLAGLPGYQLPLRRTEYADNIYWVYGMVAQDNAPVSASELTAKLSEKNIGTRPFFWCMHEQPVFRKMDMCLGESYPTAEHMARNGFYIPGGLGMSDSQIQEVSETIWGIVRG